MTASELRELAERAKWYSSQTFVPAYTETFATAAEVLELVAWAEDRDVDIERDGAGWYAYINGVEYGGRTFTDTLRRAREAGR